jgi:glycosyltransferase involved in cell wall biosynthesis
MSTAGRSNYQLSVRMLDALNHSSVAPIRSCALFLVSKILRPLQPTKSQALLSRSHTTLMHAAPGARIPTRLNCMIERDLIRACRRDRMVEALAPRGACVTKPSLKVGIVLKAPRFEFDRTVEKGVVVLKNTEEMDTFRRYIAMDSLLRDYVLVLEPSWSGYANPKLLSFCAFRDHPIVVMSPCAADHRFLDHLNSNLRPISIGAGDWVDPRVFHPLKDSRKRFDAVMVARWTRVKRHHLLFRALARIGDPSYRVALVAGNIPGDNDRGAILAMIDQYRLADRIAVFEDLEPTAVNEILNHSKVNLLLSRQEGSNRSLFEGFFAGVPGLAFANVIGVPLDHFTAQTGRLITADELPEALLYFREHWRRFDPRPWALANITPEVTTARLNLVLQELARERGEPWTQDIVCKSNRPEMHYYPNENDDHGFASVEELLARYRRSSQGGTSERGLPRRVRNLPK